MGVENHPDYGCELTRLQETISEIGEQLTKLKNTLPPDPRELRGEGLEAIRLREEVLETRRQARIMQLDLARREPYFGRLDFQEEGTGAPEALYIGKVGVERRSDHQTYVIDWRAPVASLFYSTAPGAADKASYMAPDGPVTGSIRLKRNLVIRGGQLQRIVDSRVEGIHSGEEPLIDEFLQYRLSESRDNRLRDIVSSIQAEQNAMIRAGKDRAMIVQGVAGSGKTTVALHRLAYLLYRYRDTMAADRVLILAPNRMFLDYIADVLPELGVMDVRQTTFIDWALERLGPEIRVADLTSNLEERFAPGRSLENGFSESAGRVKGSLAFRDHLDRCLAEYEAAYVPAGDLELWPGARLAADEIRGWFHERYAMFPLHARRERIFNRIKSWAQQQSDPYSGTNQHARRKQQAAGAVRRYVKQWPQHSPLMFYRAALLGLIGGEALTGAGVLSKEATQATVQLIDHGLVLPEDLASLVYLQGKLYGFSDLRQLDHVVIDEAQDFSPFQIALLRELSLTDSFTILGDLSQGIHADQGIWGWDELMSVFPEGACDYHTLEHSYRSTYEIITFANGIISRCDAPVALAKPVFRTGAPVKVRRVDAGALNDAVADEVKTLMARNHSSIAVVGRTQAECIALRGALKAAGFDPALINMEQERYRGGLSVVPVYLTKGLEFDAVVVADAGEANYRRTPRDARLLYVACTRALHELVVCYAGSPSPLIEGGSPS